ncbi:uncharacterized protein LOC6526020 [Drosophila yakuba]|uniref:Uncharacterized protein n=1 Tax=Drosophila yakuba TaxID=7245 RepID=B4PXX3_DROYA|nr:uncharacterized protein LOC6526020 [Drosophila yakuba]EDX02945.1 uncharacterized protein Dyak_GE15389 [Drosophila yakuba]
MAKDYSKNKHANAEDGLKQETEAYEDLSEKEKQHQLFDTQDQEDTGCSTVDHRSDCDEASGVKGGVGSGGGFTNHFVGDPQTSVAAGLRSGHLPQKPPMEYQLFVALEGVANGSDKLLPTFVLSTTRAISCPNFRPPTSFL